MVEVAGIARRRASRHRIEPPADGPEVVFAIVRPVGTAGAEFHEQLRGQLHGYGYTTRHIKLSRILSDIAEVRENPVPTSSEDLRIDALMTEGDRVCRDADEAAAIALLGVNEIRDIRAGAGGDDTAAATALPRTAYVIDSVKRPAEVTQLRQIYGDHLLVIGLQASTDSRTKELLDRIRPQRASATQEKLEDSVRKLIRRDLEEPGDDYGQNTLQTFPMSDVFIDVDNDPGVQVARIVDLLFGSPDYHVPTEVEFGMHLAYISSTRSAELGLKVGAVLVSDGCVVGLGVNEHPKLTGTPVFDASAVDIRALVLDTVRSLRGLLDSGEQAKFDADPDAYARDLLGAELRHSPMRHLTEFQPTVHAEMSALLGALRRGGPLADTTMYVTAYPCHNCAKHLVALDMNGVCPDFG
jgi:deoxycytidylate deaminase